MTDGVAREIEELVRSLGTRTKEVELTAFMHFVTAIGQKHNLTFDEALQAYLSGMANHRDIDEQ